ncbi:MAG: hypothetical protein RI841_04200 [Halomonas sp.]|nr:hypothetical protein [Halomonas sp.]MDR9438688.1 hypothetical protein [Halomonas sp.]
MPLLPVENRDKYPSFYDDGLYLLRGHTLKTAAELDIALSIAETFRKRA